jgi:FkbM family methyltransferase
MVSQQKVITRKYGPYAIELVAYFENLRKWYENENEPGTVEWMLENVLPSWNVIDAGAHIGYYSALLGHLAHQGRVWAFEASVVTFEKMLQNFDHNHTRRNVEPICMALGDTPMIEAEEALSFSGQGQTQMQTIYTEPFDFTSIDHFCKMRKVDHLELIKIDVDGWDLEVLWGARGAIKSFKPYIIVEVGDMLPFRGHSIGDVKSFVQEIGYTRRVLDLHPGNWLLEPREV